jgi:hypothetical protein
VKSANELNVLLEQTAMTATVIVVTAMTVETATTVVVAVSIASHIASVQQLLPMVIS